DGHDTLRSIVVDTPAGPRLVTREPGVVRAADLLTCVKLPELTDVELASAISYSARAVMDEIDPHTGAMARAVWFSAERGAELGDVLLLTAHHLTVDVVSWHIMLGDIAAAWRCVDAGAAPKMLPEFSSYRRWCELMWERADAPEVQAQREYWLAQVRKPDPMLGARPVDPTWDTWSTLRVSRVATPVGITLHLPTSIPQPNGIPAFFLAP